MASLKELKGRINSVKSTQKITKAKQMVAAAKLRRAQANAEAARPYAARLATVMGSLAGKVTVSESSPKLLAGTGKDQVHLVVVMTSDRGLCGGFNSTIVRLARAKANELLAQGKTVKILTVGKKGREHLIVVDAKGTRLTSDRPIPECNDRVQNEHNKSGTVKRQIAPQLTAQERAAKEVQDQKAAEARAQQSEDRKRERALLARYPNRPAHDRERAAAVAQMDEVIKTADKRIAELKLQRKKLDEEAAFHKNNPAKMPPATSG